MAEPDQSVSEIAACGAVLAGTIWVPFHPIVPGGESHGGAHELVAAFRPAEGMSVGTGMRHQDEHDGAGPGMALNRRARLADTPGRVDRAIVPMDDGALGTAMGGSVLEVQPGDADFHPEAGRKMSAARSSVRRAGPFLRSVRTGDGT